MVHLIIYYIDIKSKISHIYNAKRNYILKFLIDLHFVCKFIMYIELTISKEIKYINISEVFILPSPTYTTTTDYI